MHCAILPTSVVAGQVFLFWQALKNPRDEIVITTVRGSTNVATVAPLAAVLSDLAT